MNVQTFVTSLRQARARISAAKRLTLLRCRPAQHMTTSSTNEITHLSLSLYLSLSSNGTLGPPFLSATAGRPLLGALVDMEHLMDISQNFPRIIWALPQCGVHALPAGLFLHALC